MSAVAACRTPAPNPSPQGGGEQWVGARVCLKPSWAAIVAELMRAGLFGDALVAAVARIEGTTKAFVVSPHPTRSGSSPERATLPIEGREAEAAVQVVGKGDRMSPFVAGEGRKGDTGARSGQMDSTSAKGDTPATSRPDSRKADARAALMMVPGLTPSARLVGLQIVDHFNLRTGQCNPSMSRIAGLCGLSLRSAQRAVRALHSAGLVVCDVNGGRGHSNGFAPAWERLGGRPVFRQAHPSTNAQDEATAERVTGLALKGDTDVTQTESRNIPKAESGAALRGARKRTRGGVQRLPGQRELLPAAVIAENPKAERRLVPSVLMRRIRWDDLPARKASERLFVAYDGLMRGRGEQAVRGFGGADLAAWDEGVSAERRNRGSGLAVLQAAMERLLEEMTAAMRRAGTGPP